MPEVSAPTKPAASQWTRLNPFPGKLVVNRRLSTDESEKDTRHFEIDLRNWGLNFEPGDSVAVYPTNDPALVDDIIRALGALDLGPLAMTGYLATRLLAQTRGHEQAGARQQC